MTALTPDYSHYFWQGERIRLRPWQLEDAELRFMASLDSPALALHEDGIVLPSSVELQKERLEKIAGFKDESMLRFAIDNLEGITVGWVSLHSRDQKMGRLALASLCIVIIEDMAMPLMPCISCSNTGFGNNATKNAIRCVYTPMKALFGCTRSSGL